MSVSWLELVYFVGIGSVVCVALMFFLVVRNSLLPGQKYFRWILPVLAISILSHATLDILEDARLTTRHISEPFQLLIGPVLYFHLQFLTNQTLSLRTQIFHLGPFLISSLLYLGLLFKAIYLAPMGDSDFFIVWLLSIVVYVQLWAYYFLCRKSLKHYQSLLMQTCSEIEKLNESWVGNVMLALLISYSSLTVIYLLNHGPASIPVNQTLAIVYALVAFYICFSTLKFSFATAPVPTTIEPSRYEKSGLDEQTAQDIASKLRTFMAREKPFQEPDLKIATLAEKLNIGIHHLSQVINTGSEGEEGQNFYDFINTYRVKTVVEMFENPEFANETILNIAFESGFTSKATFNRAFKKHTGKTPLEYRREKKAEK